MTDEEMAPLLDTIRKLEEAVATMRRGVLALETELVKWKARALNAEMEKTKAETEIKEALQVLTDFLKEDDLEAAP